MALVHDVVVQTVLPSENVIVGVYDVVPKSRPEIVIERAPLDAMLAVEKSVIPPVFCHVGQKGGSIEPGHVPAAYFGRRRSEV